jgi:Tol biopolymer transport system component
MRTTLFTVLIVLALAGCATPRSFPVLERGGPAIDAGSIVFTGTDGNLYVADGSRDEVLRIAADADLRSGALRYPAYTWVGDSVVYTTQERDTDGAIATTMYAVRPGSRARRIFREEGLAPFFLSPSPDGSRVGYLGSVEGSAGFVMGSVDLSSRRRTSHGSGQPFYAAWAPDGGSLVTHVGAPGTRAGSELELQTLAAGRNAVEQTRLALAAGVFQTPDYSPDGSRIAVVLGTGDRSGIHVLNDAGEDLGVLVGLEGTAASVAWSPRGTRLAYLDGIFTRAGALVGRLYVAGYGAARPRKVSDLAIAHFWSPDGTKLLYFEPYTVGAAGGALAYRVGVYSLVDDSTSFLATMRPAPAFAAQIVPFVDQYERGYTLWSPDSRLITLNTQGLGGEQFVHVLDTESYAPTDAFRVSFTPAQGVPAEYLGLVPAEGVQARAVAAGTLPFFSRTFGGE